MNRTELHSIQGFHAPTLLAAVAHLRATFPRTKHAGDATTIIKNEGHMNGFLDAIEALEAAAKPQAPKTSQETFQPYSQPATPNQNRP